jgi:2-methylcitrate dehydratase PrpD
LDQIDVTPRLASFAAELSYEALPSDVVERGRMFLLDGAAVMVAAAGYARENDDRMLVRYLEAAAPADGPSTVVGHGIRTSPMMAAFANGCMMEVLDYSDSNLGNLTHNGTPVLPAALAVAEHVSAPWGELCAAIVAGYEVHTRLLTTVQPGHWYRGFQSAGTFGTSGAAVAAGRLLGLDAGGIAAALGVSGFIMPVSNGDNEFRGHSAKPVHGGQGATCGVSSALLARSGYRAGPLEGEPPRYHAALHILSDGPDLARAIEGFGEKWHSRDVAFKPYPLGHLIVGPVEAVLDLLAEAPIEAGEVDSVDIATYQAAVHGCGKKYSTPESNYVDCHFSMPFCVAATLIEKEMTPRQLRNDFIADPPVHELASRVVVTEDPEMSARFPAEWPLELVVRMRDGTTRSRRIDKVKWSDSRPPAWEELEEKFLMVVSPVLGEAQARSAADLIASLEGDEPITPLMDLLRG